MKSLNTELRPTNMKLSAKLYMNIRVVLIYLKPPCFPNQNRFDCDCVLMLQAGKYDSVSIRTGNSIMGISVGRWVWLTKPTTGKSVTGW